jgi:hypothetical protein
MALAKQPADDRLWYLLSGDFMNDFDKSTFTDFGKLVPGFDFLQNLTRQATASAAQGQSKLPQLGQWVAPTMNVEELEKRITELKAVQFWLDQNATALKATIQALEVQKMTLATLHGMNVNMSEMAKAFSVKMPETSYQQREPQAEAEPAPAATEAPAPAPAGVDPMQWWGALTHQFQSIAASALKEVADRHSLDAGKDMAEEAIKSATEFAESAMKSVVSQRAKPAAKPKAKAAVKSKAKAQPKAQPKARKAPVVARKSTPRTR